MPHSKYFTPLAGKISAVPHRWRLPSSKTSDLLLVVRKSGSLQLPPWPPSVGSVGPVAHPGKRRTRDHSQRRKSSYSQERPRNSRLRSKFKPAETDTITSVSISSVQPHQVCWIHMFVLENKEQIDYQTDEIDLNIFYSFDRLDKNLWHPFFFPDTEWPQRI